MAAIAGTRPGQQNARASPPVVLPSVHEPMCTEHVLVASWLDGINLGS